MRAPALRSPIVWIAAAVAALSQAPAARAQEFRFLCNGIDANGNSASDGCGPCSVNTAARWEVGTVPLHYDRTTLPTGASGVSSSRWANEIAAARASWNAVMGLALSDAGNASFRQFGDDNGQNEIFWITSLNEWNNKVGGGVNDALGVTITQNERCFNGTGSDEGSRAIFDADIVMNGVGFDWSFNSSLSTLTHEMGHAIGLGHPCINCGELMSATSQGGDLDPDGPQSGDIIGVQQLYPAPGLLGSACAGDFDCDSGLCASAGGSSFCSQTCSGACPSGMICTTVAGEGQICVFSSTEIALPGERCGPPGCADACDLSAVGPGCNLCVPLQNNTSECFAGCNAQTQAGCNAANGESCVTIFSNDNVSGVCVPGGTALRGQPCSEQNACVDGLVCVLDTPTAGICRGICENSTGTGCFNNENCLAVFGDGSAACFPAGSAQEGDACGDLSDCGRGLVCLNDDRCHQRCDQGFQCADAGQRCTAATGLSFCDPLPGEGEGEGEGEPPPPEGQCRITRGNFDCVPGIACELANPDDLIGTCTGEEGDTKTFHQCEDDEDCSSGLCESGVCTRPCDEGDCPDGYECDDDLAPAREPGGDPGLCIPESCADDPGICDDSSGFRCVYTDAKRYACSKDGDAVGGCNCGTGNASGADAFAAAVALLGLGLLRRGGRRQRRW